ncbi:MAG: nitronate monooxygenase [Candidatus Celaenobacter polaris]|nr:nitronate monooxygenase [Candidatus Celaenobacter polaris]
MILTQKYISLPELKIDDLTIKLPIIQGGMGVGISMAGLASAVADQGGIGVISSVGLGLLRDKHMKNYRAGNIIALREEIRKAKRLSSGIVGVNVMVAVSDYDDLVRTALEEEIDILFLGAGLPLRLPNGVSIEFLKSVKTKIIPIVSSARAAKIIFQIWEKKFNHIPDGVVVEGPKAGGHLGFKPEQIDDPAYALEEIFPQVVSVIKPFRIKYGKDLPVIAAGGIFTGEDIFRFLQMGASGVQMGTRFVATNECDADIRFKEQYIYCKKEDIVIIKSPVGLPGRAIINNFLRDVSAGIKKPFTCPWKCLKTCDFKTSLYCIAKALMKAKIGNLTNGFSFAGSNAYRIQNIISVKELIESLKNEFENACLQFNKLLEPGLVPIIIR